MTCLKQPNAPAQRCAAWRDACVLSASGVTRECACWSRLLAGILWKALNYSKLGTDSIVNPVVVRPHFPPRAINGTYDHPGITLLINTCKLAINYLEQLPKTIDKLYTRYSLPWGRRSLQHGNILIVLGNVIKVSARPARFNGDPTQGGKHLGQIELEAARTSGFSSISDLQPVHGSRFDSVRNAS